MSKKSNKGWSSLWSSKNESRSESKGKGKGKGGNKKQKNSPAGSYSTGSDYRRDDYDLIF